MTATPFSPFATRHSREGGSRELEAAGIERRQAEAIAGGMREAAAPGFAVHRPYRPVCVPWESPRAPRRA